jgi:uncharacterized membrane protein YfhO
MYLVIKGLTYEPDKTKDAAQSIITFTRDGESKKLILYSATHPFNHGRQDYIVNLGYDKDGAVKDINIAFSGTGAYSYRSITAVCQPVKKIDEMTERLASGAMKDAGIGTNSISGTVAAGESGILCIAVPYSSGWTVYIDGRKADTFRINSMYIGTGISGGEHRINMRYCTPYRNPGILCSFIGVIMAVAAGITGSRRKAS